jgi:DivIVA domain-containing protein
VSSLPKVTKGKYGYSTSEVDLLLARARDQYANPNAKVLDWRELTAQSFNLEKGGYVASAVDAAIDKLQDTFAERELKFSIVNLGDAKILLEGRCQRPKGKKFGTNNVLARGYSRKEVDALLELVQEHLAGEDEITIDELRELSFKVQRGGYIESQVDAYFDRLVEFVQKQRFAQSSVVVTPSTSTVVDGDGYQPGPNSQLY